MASGSSAATGSVQRVVTSSGLHGHIITAGIHITGTCDRFIEATDTTDVHTGRTRMDVDIAGEGLGVQNARRPRSCAGAAA